MGAIEFRRNRLLLVDGHAYAYRAFYAIRGLKAPDGQPTNAIFGFIKMLDKARTLANPTHVVVMWDGGLDEERIEALPDYKGQRPAMPDEMEVQLDQIESYLEAAGMLSVCHEGVEADDLIAATAAEAGPADWNVVIATSDKDFMQLVSPSVQLLNPGDKVQPIWDEAKVIEKTGVQPFQIVDWLSLVGDNVDNIQGVPGVGAKTAAKLLIEFESVDELYRSLEKVQSERLRTVLLENKDVVMRNRGLVRLKTVIEGAPHPGECVRREEDRRRLGRLCQGWGFKSMARAYGADESGQECLF